jgi:hypothetical protein
MKKAYKTMVKALVILIMFSVFITSVEAGDSMRVAVSCVIPSLIEMNLEPENIASTDDKTEKITDTIFVEQENKIAPQENQPTTLVSENASEETSLKLYSFYEK